MPSHDTALGFRNGVDALVDDYLGNVSEFLTNSHGPAVLVDQPWNRTGRDELASYVSERRVDVVTALGDVPRTLALLTPASCRARPSCGRDLRV
jgi:hypothetical protein